jgi:uncharacterized protein
MNHQTCLAAAVMLACGLSAASAGAEVVPPATISVSGEAHVSVPPDLAEIDGGFTSEAKTALEAANANDAGMGKVLLALKAAGIAEKDFQTSRLSLQPVSAPNRASGGPVQIVGYRASNRVTIRLHDVSKVASVIDMLVGAGANDIGGINFMVSEASKLLDDARTEAMADARRKAEIYARAAGVTLARRSAFPKAAAVVLRRCSFARWRPGWPRRRSRRARRRCRFRSVYPGRSSRRRNNCPCSFARTSSRGARSQRRFCAAMRVSRGMWKSLSCFETAQERPLSMRANFDSCAAEELNLHHLSRL